MMMLICVTAVAVRARAFDGWQTDAQAYRITLCRDGKLDDQIIVTGALPQESGQLVRHPEGVSVKVTWRDVSPTERHWRIEATPDADSTLGVYEVQFPIVLLEQLANDGTDRLLAPYGVGKVIRDPFYAPDVEQGGLPRQRTAIWYGIYPELRQNLQLLIYDDGNDMGRGEGVMIWTQDSQWQIKDFEIAHPGPGTPAAERERPVLCASVHSYPPDTGRPGVGYTSSYPVVTTAYDNGWQNALKHYRNWAIQQPWCEAGPLLERINRGDLPEWYRNNAMWATAFNGGNTDWLKDTLRPAFPDVEIGVFVTMWQKWPFDVNLPDYFPPKDEESYKRLLTLEERGFHFFPYMNVHLVDVEQPNPKYDVLVNGVNMQGPSVNPGGWNSLDNYSQYWNTQHERTREFVALLTEVRDLPWEDPKVQALVSPEGGKLYSDWFWCYAYQKDIIHDYLQSHWSDRDAEGNPDMKVVNNSIIRIRRKFHAVCRDTDEWHDAFFELIGANVKSPADGGYGSDGHYLDQLDGLGFNYVCFAEDHTFNGHAHAPGFSNSNAIASRRLVKDLHKAFPHAVWMAEHASEMTVDLVQEHYVIHPSYYQTELVPMWPLVYQGYTCFHEWPLPRAMLGDMNNLSSSIAWSVHLGFKLGSFVHAETWMDLFKPENADAKRYLQDLVAMQLQLMDLVAYGQRMTDPGVTTAEGKAIPTQVVDWMDMGAKSYTHEAPVIRGSCWQSLVEPTRQLVLLSNSGPDAMDVCVQTAMLPAGAVLVDLQTGESTAYSAKQVFTVPAYGWLALISDPNSAGKPADVDDASDGE